MVLAAPNMMYFSAYEHYRKIGKELYEKNASVQWFYKRVREMVENRKAMSAFHLLHLLLFGSFGVAKTQLAFVYDPSWTSDSFGWQPDFWHLTQSI